MLIYSHSLIFFLKAKKNLAGEKKVSVDIDLSGALAICGIAFFFQFLSKVL